MQLPWVVAQLVDREGKFIFIAARHLHGPRGGLVNDIVGIDIVGIVDDFRSCLETGNRGKSSF